MPDSGSKQGGRFAPLCFDGREHELAVSIVWVQRRIISIRGYDPVADEREIEARVCKVETAVAAAFSTSFGRSPHGRFNDVFEQIAHFAGLLALDHIFPDGNKRTTLISMLAILYRAGIDIDIDDSEYPDSNVLYRAIQDLVTKSISETQFAAQLRESARNGEKSEPRGR